MFTQKPVHKLFLVASFTVTQMSFSVCMDELWYIHTREDDSAWKKNYRNSNLHESQRLRDKARFKSLHITLSYLCHLCAILENYKDQKHPRLASRGPPALLCRAPAFPQQPFGPRASSAAGPASTLQSWTVPAPGSAWGLASPVPYATPSVTLGTGLASCRSWDCQV